MLNYILFNHNYTHMVLQQQVYLIGKLFTSDSVLYLMIIRFNKCVFDKNKKYYFLVLFENLKPIDYT